MPAKRFRYRRVRPEFTFVGPEISLVSVRRSRIRLQMAFRLEMRKRMPDAAYTNANSVFSRFSWRSYYCTLWKCATTIRCLNLNRLSYWAGQQFVGFAKRGAVLGLRRGEKPDKSGDYSQRGARQGTALTGETRIQSRHGLAPAFSNKAMTSACFPAVAASNAVAPSSFLALTSAPLLTRACTSSR